jgi:ABC-type sugar transport system permease subunit
MCLRVVSGVLLFLPHLSKMEYHFTTQFIGVANYTRLVHDRLFWKAIGNTLKFLLLHIPLQLVVSLFLAYLLNHKLKAISFFRSAFFMPVIISGVVVTILWQQLLGFDAGLINRMLAPLGFSESGMAGRSGHGYLFHCGDGYLEKRGFICDLVPGGASDRASAVLRSGKAGRVQQSGSNFTTSPCP